MDKTQLTPELRQIVKDLIFGGFQLDPDERQASIERAIELGFYQRKTLSNIKAINSEAHEVEFIISTDTVDRDGERVLPRSFEKHLKLYLDNPVVLWAHNHHEPAVAVMMNHTITDSMMTATDKFAVDENPQAAVLWKLYSADPPFMKAVSVGFIPLDWTFDDEHKLVGQDGRTFLESELIEHSLVNVGSNRHALTRIYQDEKDSRYKSILEAMLDQSLVDKNGNAVSYDKDMNVIDIDTGKQKIFDRIKTDVQSKENDALATLWNTKNNVHLEDNRKTRAYELRTESDDKELTSRTVVRFQDLPKAAEGTRWSFSTSEQNEVLGDPPDYTRYRRAHVWYDPDKQDQKSGYKLPIAKIIGGELKVVFRGVAAAMAAVNGARTPLDISESDRRGAYNHLRRYYRKFDREAPEFRTVPSESEQKFFMPSIFTIPGTRERDSRDLNDALRSWKDANLDIEPWQSFWTVGTTDTWVICFAPDLEDRKSTRLNSSHSQQSRMPSSA